MVYQHKPYLVLHFIYCVYTQEMVYVLLFRHKPYPVQHKPRSLVTQAAASEARYPRYIDGVSTQTLPFATSQPLCVHTRDGLCITVRPMLAHSHWKNVDLTLDWCNPQWSLDIDTSMYQLNIIPNIIIIPN